MSVELRYEVDGSTVRFEASKHEYRLEIRPNRVRVGVNLHVDGSLIHSDSIDLGKAKDRDAFLGRLDDRVSKEAVDTELLALVSVAQDERANIDPAEDDDRSHATLLVDMLEDVELIQTPELECYGTFQVGEHRETWHIRSRTFRSFAARRFYESEGKTPGGQALADALNVLEGKARYDGVEQQVFVRIAEHEGDIFLDLANEAWEAVHITPGGWKIVAAPPVRFRRARGTLALPRPTQGGSLELLRAFLNLKNEDDWILLRGWLVNTLRPNGPFLILIFNGEQGSAKSTGCRYLRAVVDPNTAALRSEPREVRDLMIAATNGWVVAFDNISSLPNWLSDVLCRLSTGGGFGTRELYTDDEEKLFDAQRPIILNGIEEFANRGDIQDRAMNVTLAAIAKEDRRTEEEMNAAWQEAAPLILGALLDAVSGALRNYPDVEAAQLPRMADAAKWIMAAEAALGCEPGEFLRAFVENQKIANELPLEAEVLSMPLMELAKDGDWEGTATELLERLEGIAGEKTIRRKQWPKAANVLTNRLRRLAPNLRAEGIDIEFPRRRGRRIVSIRTSPKDTDPIVPPAPTTKTPMPILASGDDLFSIHSGGAAHRSEPTEV